MKKIAENPVARLINARMIELGLNTRQLSIKSKVDYSTVYRTLHEADYSAGRKKIENLLNFLGIPTPSLDSRKIENEIILIFRTLPESKKPFALSLLKTLKNS